MKDRKQDRRPATDVNAGRETQRLPPLAPSQDQIAARAYERFLSRGGADGNDLDDWLSAERELRERQA